MSTDYSQQQNNGGAGGGGDNGNGGGDASADLQSQLGGGGAETEFVVNEEKKPATQGLIFLAVLVVIGIGGTYFMYQRQGPSAAVAATPEAQKAEATINTFLTSGPDGIKMMQTMLKDTEKVVKQFLEYPSMTQIPLTSLHTNPFKSGPDKPAAVPADVTAELAAKKREEEKLAATKASEDLKLQSIIFSGARKACMINNTLYKEGEQIAQFTIEKIEPGRVIVKTGVYRFELKAKR
jgi:hypothetical protein